MTGTFLFTFSALTCCSAMGWRKNGKLEIDYQTLDELDRLLGLDRFDRFDRLDFGRGGINDRSDRLGSLCRSFRLVVFGLLNTLVDKI